MWFKNTILTNNHFTTTIIQHKHYCKFFFFFCYNSQSKGIIQFIAWAFIVADVKLEGFFFLKISFRYIIFREAQYITIHMFWLINAYCYWVLTWYWKIYKSWCILNSFCLLNHFRLVLLAMRVIYDMVHNMKQKAHFRKVFVRGNTTLWKYYCKCTRKVQINFSSLLELCQSTDYRY